MRIAKLDGLRGVFSLMIVFFHYNEGLIPANFYNNFFIRESYYAVDFFFVLSGFVISHKYHTIKSIQSFSIYIKKRFVRLYPLLIFTTTIYFGVDLIFNYFLPEHISTVESFSKLFTKYLDTIFFTNSTPILGNTFGMNPPSWSISTEMISYLVFGLIMVLTYNKYKNIAFFMIILTATIFTILNGWLFEIIGDYSFVRGFISFNIGYFVWVLSLKKFRMNNMLEFLLPILLCFFLFLSYNLSGLNKSLINSIVIPLFFGFSIITFLKTDGFLSKILNTKPLQFLGKISYSVYLNHFIVLVLVPKGIFTFLNLPQTDLTEVVVLILTITIILIYSSFTYKLIEIKGGTLLRKLLS